MCIYVYVGVYKCSFVYNGERISGVRIMDECCIQGETKRCSDRYIQNFRHNLRFKNIICYIINNNKSC